MPKKKYKLKCFNCGSKFYSKEDVCRINGYPYCGECEGNYQSNIAEQEVYDWKMKEWQERHPGVDYEQWLIDRANIRKYGEC